MRRSAFLLTTRRPMTTRPPRALIVLGLLFWVLPGFTQTLRVTPEWVHAHLDQPGLVIIDARPTEDYAQGHIPGAVNLPESATYSDWQRNGRIVEPGSMQALLRDLGITRDAPTLVYDDGDLIVAARVFWVLEVYGLRDLRVLDQGLQAWRAQGLPITTVASNPPRSDYIAEIDPRRIATRFTVQIAVANPAQLIIDARPPEAYQGQVSKARRFGHIPSAINIPLHEHLTNTPDGSRLRDLDVLAALYAEVPKERALLLYCDFGRASAVNYIALRELGYQVANYDASWLEWGNDPSLPIVGPSDGADVQAVP